MKPSLFLAALILLPLLSVGQSIRYGINESNLNTVKPNDFDLAGTWQGNRFEVVYDSDLNEVVRFDFVDSLSNLVFIRQDIGGVIFYNLLPINQTDTNDLGLITIMKDSSKFVAFSRMNSEIKYECFSDVASYGSDALQLNIDVPEDEVFFKRKYRESEDLNIFWEFIRASPQPLN